ncbi:MAG TPA: methyltransferase domain-containing protein [Caulobacteraceae bacterium]|nr:methyltransferase domain-containing protein [Caulobacteraceae bacterium]
MDEERLARLRRGYAEEICRLARVTHAPVEAAFAAVPRERFLGPGPWRTGLGSDAMTPDDDPAHIYKNVLVSLDAEKRLNNGEPTFWAFGFDAMQPHAGERAIHVGAGTGYYTALLAQMVGPSGAVTAIEFEPDLAAKAQANLADQPNVEVLAGDGLALARGEADLVMASCGVDQVPVAWVKLLRDGGRLFVPLTASLPQWSGGGGGVNLLVTRRGDAYEARWAGNVAIYNCMAGRTDAASERLRAAFRFPADLADWPRWRAPEIASLRLDDREDATTWLAGDGWQLSTAPPAA